MNKLYSRIEWENEPSDKTPLNEENLNKMDSAIELLDNRVIEQDSVKATKTEVSSLISNIFYNDSSGVITVYRKNGSFFEINANLSKIAVNFEYDSQSENIILTQSNGEKCYIDLSALITEFEFSETDTVVVSVDSDGKVYPSVKDGSIQEKHLRPDYLADIKVEGAKVELCKTNAQNSEDNARNYMNNAKVYSDNASTSSEIAKQYEELSASILESQKGLLDETNKKLSLAVFDVDNDGNLIYTEGGAYFFEVDDDGNLNWEVI